MLDKTQMLDHHYPETTGVTSSTVMGLSHSDRSSLVKDLSFLIFVKYSSICRIGICLALYKF